MRADANVAAANQHRRRKLQYLVDCKRSSKCVYRGNVPRPSKTARPETWLRLATPSPHFLSESNCTLWLATPNRGCSNFTELYDFGFNFRRRRSRVVKLSNGQVHSTSGFPHAQRMLSTLFCGLY